METLDSICFLAPKQLGVPIEVEIYDVNGRIFINKYLEIGENIINTSHLSSGFYLIKLTHNNRKKVDILIKK